MSFGQSAFPMAFLGHGSPMNALEPSTFSATWQRLGRAWEKPRGILCISAHWETRGSRVTAQDQPPLIYDFYGFPEALYQISYPAPGSPDLAKKVCQLLGAEEDSSWGLDHGSWSLLLSLAPQADVPVVQLSLDTSLSPQQHFQLARRLQPLRHEGILILASGNIVHNLREINWDGGAYPWAREFDAQIVEWIRQGAYEKVVNFGALGPMAQASVPTLDHFLPLLYILALAEPQEALEVVNQEVTLGSLSMTGVVFGPGPSAQALA